MSQSTVYNLGRDFGVVFHLLEPSTLKFYIMEYPLIKIPKIGHLVYNIPI